MSALASILIELNLDDGEFTGKIVKNTAALGTFKNQLDTTSKSVQNIEKATTGFIARLRDIEVVLAAARQAFGIIESATTGWTGKIIETNAELERMQKLMEGLSKATTEQARIQEGQQGVAWIREAAKTAPFALEQITNAFVKMKSVGIDPTNGSLKGILDAIAKFGGGTMQLQEASLALMEMGGKGVVEMKELRRQLGQAIPSAMQDMAAAMGVTYAQLAKMTKSATLEARTGIQLMVDEMERAYGGSAQKMMQTFNGQMTLLNQNWISLQKTVGDAGFFEAVKNQLKDINAFMSSNQAAAWGEQLGRALTNVVHSLAQLSMWLIENAGAFKQLGETLIVLWGMRLIGSINITTAAMRQLSLVMGIGQAASLSYYAGAVKTAEILNSSSMAAYRLSQGVGAISGAIGLAGRAFQIALGPLGMITLAVWTLIDAFGLLESKASKAAEAIKNGFPTSEKLALVASEIARIKEELAKPAAPSLYGDAKSGYTDAVADAALKKQLESRLKALEEIYNKGLRDETEKALQNQIKGIQDEFENAVTVAQGAYQTARNAWKAITEKDSSKESMARANADLHAAQQKEYDDRIAAAQREVDALQAIYDKQTDDQLKAQARKNLVMAQQQKQALEESGLAAMERVKAGPTILSAEGNGKGVTGAAAAILHLKEKIAELNSEIQLGNQSGHELYKIMVDIGGMKWSDKLTPAQAEEMKKLATEYENTYNKAEAFKKAQKENAEGMRELTDMTRGLDDSLVQLWAQFDEGKSKHPDPAGIRTFVANYDKAMSRLDPSQWLDAYLNRDKIVQEKYQEDLLKRMVTYQGQTRDMNAKLLDDKHQTAQALFQTENDEITAEIDRAGLGGEQKKQIMQAFYDWRAAKEKEIARSEEDGFATLARQWGDKTQMFQDLTKQWASESNKAIDDFVDKGKISFDGFVTSILADFAKMELKMALSPLMSALSSGVQGLAGGLFGGGEALGPGFQAGAPMPLQTMVSHTGSIVGSNEGWARHGLDPSMFMGARRYHTGGVNYGAGEVPAILKKGEGVFTPEQMAALGRGSGASPPVTVNVINESGVPMDAQQSQPKFDAEGMVLDVVVRAASRPGSFRDSMRGALG